MIIEKSIKLGDTLITLQSGKIAKQASGSVVITAGDTTVLVTAQGSKESKGVDFLPLTVDYQEKTSAVGKIPGGYFKRETKPRDSEILTSRLIDRSIRPLFEKSWDKETQVIATVLSADPKHIPDSLALTGVSLALGLSNLPFNTPIVGLRVAKIDNQFHINPSYEDIKEATLNIFMSCSHKAIIMVEGGGDEIDETEVIEALLFGHEQAQELLDLQKDIIKEWGKPKSHVVPKEPDQNLIKEIEIIATDKIKKAYTISDKLERYESLDEIKKELLNKLMENEEQKNSILEIFNSLKSNIVRSNTLQKKIRLDGRKLSDIRSISSETNIFPRTHGSALFQRGETQAIVTVTLGTQQDMQRIDSLFEDELKDFMLHYNFPPYSVGETRPLRAPGRREIGHGVLAERALFAIFKKLEDFPYTLRILSDITESNGSSSMATVCGGSLAMMDAGVPIENAIAGIAMGLIKEGDDIVILSDILGDEDHLGDMDFKVAGTEKGITAIQMDIKIDGVTREILTKALEQARQGRLHILSEMTKTISAPKSEMSDYAPRITKIKINVDRIRDIIGPGGKTIKDIIARTGCQINVEDDGVVTIASTDFENSQKALKIIEDLTQEAVLGKVYLGNVRKIADFGAFVEIFPGTDGLVHISELANKHVKRVGDVLQEGDEVMVKVIGIERGKIKLSRKQALEDKS